MSNEPGPLKTSDSKSNTILSTLTWHVLLRRSLNFSSCTTWFLNLDDLVESMEHDYVGSLSLTSTCQVSVERIVLDLESEVPNSLVVRIFTGIFCFHVVKPLMPTLALLPTSCIYGKTRMSTPSFCSGSLPHYPCKCANNFRFEQLGHKFF